MPVTPPEVPTIRLATAADAAQVAAIYAPFCRGDSHVSFEVEPPTPDQMARRIASTLEHHPWLVCESGGEVLGYVYAGPHNERAAYRWSVTVAAYVGAGRRRSGVGRALYESLFAALRVQGYVNAYAGVVLPNPGSVALHRSVGFTPVGIYRGVGYKCGAWQDASWWELALRDRPDRPDPALSLDEARSRPEWPGALATGLRFLRVEATE